MKEKYQQVQQIVREHECEYLLQFYEELSQKQQEQLLDQILEIDFKQMDELYQLAKAPVKMEPADIQPISYIDKEKMTEQEMLEYEAIGKKVIEDGKLAVVTMAGGQGTRLGHKGPKGTFDLGLDSHKSIFELLNDSLKQAQKTFGVFVPWYIMTSNENDGQTKAFFEQHQYFGYPKEKIAFFRQGELPMLEENGNILLGENKMLKRAADGHGGVFEALSKNNMLEDMKKKGICWVFISGVDNVLANMVDPVLMGLAIKQGASAAGKSVVKSNPEEKVGVFCTKNGKPSVVEYTEITEEMAYMTDELGELCFGESHMLCNMFHIQVLEKIATCKLPYHVAFKKANYYDKNGNWVEADKPNAYKFEAFMFDAFETIEKMAVLRVKREEEFAPVKNATGVDSPETARELYKNYHHI